MKQVHILFIALIFSFQLIAQSKVGTIDVDYILSIMPELEQVRSDVNTYSTDLENQLQVKVTKYQSLVKVYKDNEAGFTETDKKTKQDEIIALEQDIQQFQKNSTSLIQIRQNELLNPLYQKIGEAIKSVSEAGKYTQVLTIDNTIAFLDPNYDITLNVMELLGLKIDNVDSGGEK